MLAGRGLLNAALVSVVMALSLAPMGVASAVPVRSSATGAPGSQPDEASALAEAAATGERVEVAGRRSETQQVFAGPDGTLTAEVYARPVRVERDDGSWVPADPTLHVGTDGMVAPAATSVQLAFSDGGSSTLATVTRDGWSISLTWPAALPAPQLSGDTATYPEVFPGVDLRLQADTDGFSELLVVKTRAAAANPALATVRFGLRTQGLTVRADAAGGLSAVDTAGSTVFTSPPAVMWDSADSLTPASQPVPDGSVRGITEAPVAVAVGPGELAVSPNQAMLTDPGTVFPVLVDPTWTARAPAWTEVDEFDAGSATWRTPDGTLAVGYQNFQPPTRVRTFLRFGVDSRVFGTHVRSATMRLLESWSSSCTATPVQAFSTGGFTSSTTWNHQPTWAALAADSKSVAYGHDAGCPANWVTFDVSSEIATAARTHTSHPTFGLRAGNEGDPLGWKKFTSSGTNGPRMDIVYNHPPNTPGASSMSTKDPTSACVNSQATAPRVNVTPARGITLKVTPVDPDGDKVKVKIELWKYGTTDPLATYTSAIMSSRTPVAAPVMVNRTVVNGDYAWRATVQDFDGGSHPMASSVPSAYCWFKQDGTVPSPPEVSSADYPSSEYAGSAGQPGRFTFSPGASIDTDITGYRYGIDQPNPGTAVAKGAGGAIGLSATVSVAPPSYGPHDLFVQAVDGAGNRSDPMRYHFYVNAPSDPLAYFPFDEGAGASATSLNERDGSAGGATATLVHDVAWQPSGRINSAVHLNQPTEPFPPPSGYVTTSVDGTQLPANRPFAVTVWVRLTDANHAYPVISEDGSQVGAFTLRYDNVAQHWALDLPRADSTSALVDRALSTSVPTANVWTHLAAVFDGTTARLFVNGRLEGSVAHTSLWAAAGPVQIGRSMSGGTASYLHGDVDDVRIYDRVLTYDPATGAGEVADIVNYAIVATPAASWLFSEAGGATAADTSGHGTTATLAPGALFTTGGHSGGGLSLDGTGYASTAGPVVRTDQSFTVAAWVKLSCGEEACSQHPFTIASQDGTNVSGFTLQYRPDNGGEWVFSMPADDTPQGTGAVAEATLRASDAGGSWVHVAGGYNGFTHQLRLRVADSAGVRGARVTFDPAVPWRAGGALQIGRDQTTDDSGAVVYGDQLLGVIDDLNVYGGVLPDSALRALAGQ